MAILVADQMLFHRCFHVQVNAAMAIGRATEDPLLPVGVLVSRAALDRYHAVRRRQGTPTDGPKLSAMRILGFP